MGVFFDEPTYPVIDKAPHFWKTVGNFNWKDWATFAGTTAACYPFGWAVGVAPKIPKQSALMGATIGALGGFMLAHQQSAGRLMGFFPNDKEVETGLASKR
ncbi:TPA: hypothetical protein ACH3X2_010162 [Trebouxia sp. C0005]